MRTEQEQGSSMLSYHSGPGLLDTCSAKTRSARQPSDGPDALAVILVQLLLADASDVGRIAVIGSTLLERLRQKIVVGYAEASNVEADTLGLATTQTARCLVGDVAKLGDDAQHALASFGADAVVTAATPVEDQGHSGRRDRCCLGNIADEWSALSPGHTAPLVRKGTAVNRLTTYTISQNEADVNGFCGQCGGSEEYPMSASQSPARYTPRLLRARRQPGAASPVHFASARPARPDPRMSRGWGAAYCRLRRPPRWRCP